MDDFSLTDILEACTDPSSRFYNLAWSKFVARYKNYIYKVIYNRCKLWHFEQMPHDQSEFVNDIASDVFLLLTRNNCRALKQYKARHSETAFRGYLATISDRVTRRTLQRQRVFTSYDDALLTNEPGTTQETKWQAFDYLVAVLRHKAGKQERHLERNILLFNLYTLEDYTKEMLQMPPIFRGMGHRVVDNVVSRAREKLDQDDKNYLRELLLD